MIKTRALLKKLSVPFPQSIAKRNHDYVGTMVGPLKPNVSRIVLCLDFDNILLADIERLKPDLIITHHPFFFGSKKRILQTDNKKAILYQRLRELGIALISLHTNFDEGEDGMNDALAHKLQLQNIYAPVGNPMMRIGTIGQLSVDEFALLAKARLEVPYALLIPSGHSLITKVAIIGGGGARDYQVAIDEKADIFISGDAPHHVRREIVLANFNYLDVPHEVERIFMPQMKKILLSIDESLEVFCLDHEREPSVIA